MKPLVLFLVFTSFVFTSLTAQTLPPTVVLKHIDGGTFTMGNNNLVGSPDQKAAAPEHQVTVSDYSLSEAEITNAQYVEFLNAAFEDGLIQIVTGTAGPDKDKELIQGTSTSAYNGKTLYSLEGTRVMKDHDNNDNGDGTGDNNPFTGDIEPENWTESNPSAATNLPTQAEVSDWPVTFIRWWGAWAFADYYDRSLPTEAQWEYASKAAQHFTYAVHDGADIADANWNQDGLSVATHHVRAAISGTANPFGLYNLAGNS